MRPSQRDIVLIPFPFTYLSSSRRRPVIVLSNDDYNRKTEDVVVAMTSNLIQKDYVITITNDNLETGKLNRPSNVRVDKIYALIQHIIINSFGSINNNTFLQIQDLLNRLIKLA